MSPRKQIPSLSVIHIGLLHSAASVSVAPYRCLVRPDGVHPEMVNKSLNHTTITTAGVMCWKYPPSFSCPCALYSFFVSSPLFSSPVNELQQERDRKFVPYQEKTCKPHNRCESPQPSLTLHISGLVWAPTSNQQDWVVDLKSTKLSSQERQVRLVADCPDCRLRLVDKTRFCTSLLLNIVSLELCRLLR